MQSVRISAMILLLIPTSHAGNICEVKKDLSPSCGLTQETQLSNYESIFKEVTKNTEPEALLTTVDSEGIQTKKYQDFTSGTPSENPTIVKIDTAILHQSMIGFGGNITESCLENLKKLSPSDKENFFKIFFDQKSGAGFSYLRVPIGANDFSIGDYSLNDTPGNKPDPQLKLYNPKKLQVFIQFIQEAKKYNPDIKLIMTPWTAPAWMKDTKSLKGGQIKKKYYRAYSDYLIKTINEFESKGIKIDQMTILNEPLIGYAKEHWDFPQTYMSPQDQSHFIQDSLLPKLKGKQTKLLIHDHNWDNAHAADPVFADNKQNPAVQGIAYHCYGGSLSDLQKNLKNHPGVPAFNTECTSSLNHHSDEDTFNWWQDTQSLDAIKSGISGSLGWNLCLDEKGGPQNNGCEDCRGLMTIDSKTSAMTLNPEFKALATTSRVLDSGSIMIDSKESNPQATSIAFKNPDGSLSMVLKNKSKISQAYNVNVDSCASKKYFLPAGATLSVRWFPD